MKRAIIVHQWSGTPQTDWYPWAKQQLEDRGYTVLLPTMPDTDAPQIEPWVKTLQNTVGQVQETDILIGHSIGCQTIMRFLAQLPSDKTVTKVIFVAPWFTLSNLSSQQAEIIAKPWIETPIDFTKVKQKTKKFISLFSKNDKYVSYDVNIRLFKERINTEIITEENMGHFTQDDGIKELPQLLKLL
jgi:predicted alpha/beta hydrolase family esterase